MSARRDGAMPWFRFYGGDVLGDPKLAMLTDAQFRVWVNLLCLASTQSERGMIVGMGDKLLAAMVARGNQELVRETLHELEDLCIIATQGEADAREIVFINFVSRQYDKPSDQPERVAARVAASRERKRNAPVTLCNAQEEETDPEPDLSPSDPLRDLPSPGDAVPAPAASPRPPSALSASAEAPDLPVSEHTQAAPTEAEAAKSAPAASPAPASAPKRKPIYAEDSVPMQLARTLGAGIHRHKPDAKLPRGEGWQAWAREMDLALRIDHRPREKIEAVIAYATGSSFWRGVIFSARKLREKFDVLDAQRLEDANGGRRQTAPARAGQYARPSGSGGYSSAQRLPTQDDYRAFAQRLRDRGQLAAQSERAESGESGAGQRAEAGTDPAERAAAG